MPTSGLPGTGNLSLSYNGLAFSDPSTRIVSARAKPNLDASGRTVVSVTHSFRFSAIITPADLLDTTTTNVAVVVRNQLSPSAGEFIFTGSGYGDFHVNPPGAGGVRDLSWGPHVRGMDFEQIGNDQAWRVTWDLETTLLDQCAKPVYQDKPLEWTYSIDWVKAPNGYSRRTISGTLKIPQTRASVSSRALLDHADHYLEQVLPPIPFGFRREPVTHALDESKCVLRFSTTDVELPGIPPPPGVVFAHLKCRYQTNPRAFIEWKGSLDGQYELAKFVPRSEAFNYFWQGALDRLKAIQALTIPSGGIVIPINLTLDSGDFYEVPSGSFSLTFSFTVTAEKVKKALGISQIWSLPPSADYAAWATSMQAQEVSTPRGYAKLGFDVGDDGLLDLCGGKVVTVSPGAATKSIKVNVAGVGAESDINPFNMTKPDPKNSWLAYECTLEVRQEDNVAVLRPLPLGPVNYTSPGGNMGALGGWKAGYAASAPKPIIQRRGAPLIYAILRGRALRAGYEITPPVPTTIGGVDAIPCNDGSFPVYQSKIIANYGIPVVGATWEQRFVLAGIPQVGLVAPDNPMLGSLTQGDKIDKITMFVQG